MDLVLLIAYFGRFSLDTLVSLYSALSLVTKSSLPKGNCGAAGVIILVNLATYALIACALTIISNLQSQLNYTANFGDLKQTNW